MYFSANVNGAFDIYRLAENDGMSRVSLLDGVSGALTHLGGTRPAFTARANG